MFKIKRGMCLKESGFGRESIFTPVLSIKLFVYRTLAEIISVEKL